MVVRIHPSHFQSASKVLPVQSAGPLAQGLEAGIRPLVQARARAQYGEAVERARGAREAAEWETRERMGSKRDEALLNVAREYAGARVQSTEMNVAGRQGVAETQVTGHENVARIGAQAGLGRTWLTTEAKRFGDVVAGGSRIVAAETAAASRENVAAAQNASREAVALISHPDTRWVDVAKVVLEHAAKTDASQSRLLGQMAQQNIRLLEETARLGMWYTPEMAARGMPKPEALLQAETRLIRNLQLFDTVANNLRGRDPSFDEIYDFAKARLSMEMGVTRAAPSFPSKQSGQFPETPGTSAGSLEPSGKGAMPSSATAPPGPASQPTGAAPGPASQPTGAAPAETGDVFLPYRRRPGMPR